MADIADAASGQEHGAGPEWLLTGIAYFGCACLVCLLCIVAFVFATRKNPLLDLGYFVYVNTALGQWIHNLQLAQVRQRAAEARKAGDASGAFHSAVESLEVSICPTADEADGVEVTVIPLPCLKDNYVSASHPWKILCKAAAALPKLSSARPLAAIPCAAHPQGSWLAQHSLRSGCGRR